MIIDKNNDLLKELQELRKRVKSFESSESEHGLYGEIIAHMAEGVCLTRVSDGVIAYNNPKFEKMFGYGPDELAGKHVSTVNAAADKSSVGTDNEIIKVLHEKGVWSGETLNMRKDGTHFWCYAVVSKFEHPAHGQVWISIHQDITARRKAEAETAKSKQMLEAITQGITESILLLSTDFKIKWANKTALTQTGLSAEKLIGNYCYRTTHNREQPCEAPGDPCPVYELIKTGEPKTGVHVHYNRSGNTIFVEVSAYPVKNDSGEIVEIVHVSKDITERKKREEELRNLSLTDELTGLYNRRGFFTLAQQLQKRAKREKKGLFMLYADLDGLKEINDTYGHQEGDKALIEIANILKETYRESDIVARIGGDEFAMIPIGEKSEDVKVITARMQKNIDSHNAGKTRGHKLSISWGTAYFNPSKPVSIDTLLSHADKAMYEQKQLKKKHLPL